MNFSYQSNLQQMNDYDNTCFCCKQNYDDHQRKPFLLACGDVICLLCYNNQKNNAKNKQVQCPINSSHLYPINESDTNQLSMQKLQQNDFYPIKCQDHLNENANIYCKQQNKLVCSVCLQTDPHAHFLQDQSLHFAFERKYLDESLEKMLPILSNEIKEIQSQIDRINQFINKEREFQIQEIQNMIEKIFNILKFSKNTNKAAPKDQIKKKLKDQGQIFNFISNFSQFLQFNLYYRDTFKQFHQPRNDEEQKYAQGQNQEEVKANEQIDYLVAETLGKLEEADRPKYLEFRRLVDIHLETLKIKNLKDKSKLLPISGKSTLIFKATNDGFVGSSFHQKCNNQGPTISFILSEHGQVFGGYTSVSWTTPYSYSYFSDLKAFIFSLSKNTLLKQYQNFSHSVYHQGEQLMCFGYGGDIYISYGCNTRSDSYCNLGGTYKPKRKDHKNQILNAQDYLGGSVRFRVIEIEVYQIQA
ncbi:tldc domain-containing protein [Stylonychia lemnae]|uniref:Tldc domain-containing protein n=1 Tax=Stylonychia lemnae TaxID=5949 RepID=A0A078AWQ9_STYLE|nr:tldc domain-containing protein [Stylonychia lemnae]|eukprot:CDW86599.1 tldc domain-containing protein [Stylonychia lemnae]